MRFALGMMAWALAAFAIGRSVVTIYAQAARPVEFVAVQLDAAMTLTPGDLVYLTTESGLQHVGEVAAPPREDGVVALALDPQAARGLNASTVATVWRTPLAAEDALAALLPPTIQRKAAEIMVEDWRKHQDALAENWGPLAADLAMAYVKTIRVDLEDAVRAREEDFAAVAAKHGRTLSEFWPEVEARVSPILAAHLTPVLTRLLEDALAEAPKVSIVWQVARGRHGAAFRVLLDWLADYLLNMPPRDQAAINDALETTLQRIREDRVIVGHFSRLGSDILHDDELAEVLAGIYRQAVTDNPRTARFLQEEVMRSPDVQEQFYSLIERFGPTARRVAATCLFDDQGTTRPEIVHLARSIALDREVSWVTLDTPDRDAASRSEGVPLPAEQGGAGP